MLIPTHRSLHSHSVLWYRHSLLAGWQEEHPTCKKPDPKWNKQRNRIQGTTGYQMRLEKGIKTLVYVCMCGYSRQHTSQPHLFYVHNAYNCRQSDLKIIQQTSTVPTPHTTINKRCVAELAAVDTQPRDKHSWVASRALLNWLGHSSQCSQQHQTHHYHRKAMYNHTDRPIPGWLVLEEKNQDFSRTFNSSDVLPCYCVYGIT